MTLPLQQTLERCGLTCCITSTALSFVLMDSPRRPRRIRVALKATSSSCTYLLMLCLSSPATLHVRDQLYSRATLGQVSSPQSCLLVMPGFKPMPIAMQALTYVFYGVDSPVVVSVWL